MHNSLSKDKSYFLGYQRGHVWAVNHADYIDLRQLSEYNIEDFSETHLPKDEEMYFRYINRNNELDSDNYLSGWLDAVKEARKKHAHHLSL